MNHRQLSSKVLSKSIACVLFASGMMLAAPVIAQDVSFDLGAADLKAVLPEFGRQAGLQIVAPSDAIGGIRTKQIKGTMNSRQALALLLEGTGITIASDNGNTIALRAARPTVASLRGATSSSLSSGATVVQAASPADAAVAAPLASEPAVAESNRVSNLDKVEVVGTQIKRAAASEALLPVLGIKAEQIEAIGAINGDDLYRSIPQMGDVTFRSGLGTSSSNFARGDIAGVNLRGLGAGNTLLLINGRRTVMHPTSQGDENGVPAFTYNVNAIPIQNLERVDVLLNGASAIYGADAVAGVVNNVLMDDYDGAQLSMQYGAAEGTDLRDRTVSGLWGKNFNDMRGNFTLAYTFQDSTGLNSQDQDWTAKSDRTADFVGTRFEGFASLNRTEGYTRYGNFTALHPEVIRQNGVALTSAAGFFHTQPAANAGCIAQLTPDTCVESGTQSISGPDRNLRNDPQKLFPMSFDPEYNRVNLFGTTKYDFESGVGFFSELGYYRSRSQMIQPQATNISSQIAVIDAGGYWNPFGALYLPDGSLNPNRLPGLNIPEEGVDVAIRTIGMERPTSVEVDHKQYRFLAGLRGLNFGFDWETALLYSEATVTDSMNAISATGLEAAMALRTPDAYNPFATGTNSDEVIDSITFNAVRATRSTLALWDFKASRPDLFSIPAGNIGIAFGGEVRRETQKDDRDPHVDGTITWTSLSGVQYPGDMYGVSPTPDTYGERTVSGVYAEFYIPLVSTDWRIPFVRSLDMQIAGRAEHYSDFGRVSKPKIALGWEIFDGLSARASWSEAFRAPNLEQVNAELIIRNNNRIDPLLCEVDVRNGRLARFQDCAINYGIAGHRMGNSDLKPETSENLSVGLVFEPKFLPESAGRVRLSLDYFKYEQEGIIGMYGDLNHLALDYLQRVNGSTNPSVIRREPNAEDIARFAGTGIAPVGEVLYVVDQFVNLLPQRVRGFDFGLNWISPETRIGTFNLAVNGTRVIEFFREVPPDVQVLRDASDAGTINASTMIVGGGSLLMVDGKPEWKWTTSLLWTRNNLQAALTSRYVGDYYESRLRDSTGVYWNPGSSIFWNGHVKYSFNNSKGWLSDSSIKIGVNNLQDRRPPITSDHRGYLSSMYVGTPRYWYVNITKEF